LNDAQPNSPVFFLDKNHGLLIRDMLKRVNLRVVAHKDLGWHPDMADVTIIKECAARNFIIVSGDKAMARVPEERQAIIEGKCKVFMFEDSDRTRTEDWIASFLVGRQRIMEIISKTTGPLFVTIKPCRTRGHIGSPQFVDKAGGGWLVEGKSIPEPVLVLENPVGKQRPHKPQQSVLEFPLPPASGKP
jgi:hypothetical protein